MVFFGIFEGFGLVGFFKVLGYLLLPFTCLLLVDAVVWSSVFPVLWLVVVLALIHGWNSISFRVGLPIGMNVRHFWMMSLHSDVIVVLNLMLLLHISSSVLYGMFPYTMLYKRIPSDQTVADSPWYLWNLIHSGGNKYVYHMCLYRCSCLDRCFARSQLVLFPKCWGWQCIFVFDVSVNDALFVTCYNCFE